jgi:uncharacterized membrane protein YccC
MDTKASPTGRKNSLSTRAKEAIKTGLAFALVYGIALKSGWMNPSWAAIAVVMISLGTAGESIHKSVLRLAGTIPGCVAALIILSLAAQDRWLFITLSSGWIFFTTYMMLRSGARSYFWMVAGFVCLIIAVSSTTSSASAFSHAVFRTVETAMGIVVYCLITVFLWPRTNAGAIRKASVDLVSTQADLFHAGQDAVVGRGTQEMLAALRTQEVQHLGKLAQALQAEGSERYEVREVRHLWNSFLDLSTAAMETLNCWQTGFAELVKIDMHSALPDLATFYAELDLRFKAIQTALGGSPPAHDTRAVSLTIDKAALRGLSPLDRASLAVAKKQLESMESLTATMLRRAQDLADLSPGATKLEPMPSGRNNNWDSRLPMLDLDSLRGATFAATSVAAVFLVWIYINPPGHSGWYTLGGPLALMIAQAQHLRMTTFIKPFALTAALALGVYVFIMPQLSSFTGLGLTLFMCMFINRYFFAGLSQAMGNIAIISMISIQNQQTYSFAAMANVYIFILMAFGFLFAMSYMLRSARPEKAVLNLLGRFFRSAEFLVSRVGQEPGRRPLFLERWKTAFYRREMQALPAKIGVWGKSIDCKLFPKNAPEQTQALVPSLQALGYRIEELLEAGSGRHAELLAQEIQDVFRGWRAGMETAFGEWSEKPETVASTTLKERVAAKLGRLETRIDERLAQSKVKPFSDEEAESLYRLLGGFRGVSEAAIAYAGVAGKIDWVHWREEVFS